MYCDFTYSSIENRSWPIARYVLLGGGLQDIVVGFFFLAAGRASVVAFGGMMMGRWRLSFHGKYHFVLT